jgi:predicted DsbA family dithiol-disulfide isomerase
MKIEIWSDIVCPFCYIGKRKLESALSQVKEINNLEIVWKSFLLDPDLVSDEQLNLNQYLLTHKGISMERAIS